MKILYLDCGMGAAGDMLTAALLELFPNQDEILKELNGLGIPGVVFEKEVSVKCGITGSHMKVTVNGKEEESYDYHDEHHHDHAHDHHHHGHEHEHHHRHEHHHDHHHEHHHTHSHEHEKEHGHDTHHHNHHHEHDHSHGHHHHSRLRDIEHIVRDHLSLPKKVKDDVMAVYTLIAEGESHVHGVPMSEIHFHEVGTMDAIADITAVCLLMNRLSPDEVIASPVHVGSGQVKCAHGILPVPAPATAHILRDVPIYGGNIRGELCTPTGAALLKHFVSRFDNMPIMKTKAIGYGMGKKDFAAANCVRAMLGESEGKADEIYELSCNVDDMTGEAIGFAMERLLEAGALEVYTTAIGMKKSRPGTAIHVMCREKDREFVARLLFKYTTTIGVRENKFHRYVLERHSEEKLTQYGLVSFKLSSGYGVSRKKYEYEALARIAKEKNISIEAAAALIEKE